jgi:hypothetical protein
MESGPLLHHVLHAVGLAMLARRLPSSYSLTFDRFHWPDACCIFMSVVNSRCTRPAGARHTSQIDFYFKMLLQYYLICAFIRDEKVRCASSTGPSPLSVVVVAIRYCYGKFLHRRAALRRRHGRPQRDGHGHGHGRPLLFMLGLTTRDVRKRALAWSLARPPRPLQRALPEPRRHARAHRRGAYMLYRLHHKRWICRPGHLSAASSCLGEPPSTEVTARFMSIGRASKTDASARSAGSTPGTRRGRWCATGRSTASASATSSSTSGATPPIPTASTSPTRPSTSSSASRASPASSSGSTSCS